MKADQKARPRPLLYADSERNADQFYFGKVLVPDPFISFQVGRKKYALINALEYNRLKRESAFDEVLSLEEWLERARKKFRRKRVGLTEILRLVAYHFNVSGFVVPSDFPAGLAFQLKAARVKIDVAEGSLFRQRQIKSETETRAIKEGNAASVAGIRTAEKILRAAQIKGGKLFYKGRALTAERLRQAIEIACLKRGAVAARTIVAGGDQACDPHGLGSGILRAHELIVIDVFPRVSRTGYFGDMTRTFLKGHASAEQRRLVGVVREAQRRALGAIKAEVSGAKIHRLVTAYFAAEGYVTVKEGDRYRGFFHGTGHGLGLEVHEPPCLNQTGSRLKAGMVTTVEPGLYYPGLGACRIEDVVHITRAGVEMLSHYHYRWEIC